ncbi:uncharacterized protein LOC104886575 [Beta vulgaris subsp. vulgaris]|uniref:uncharacterized protein LOC104886575 n=1 Tax=Beta vulgaris subsp. vulgaris TaxID=3555 RepID=UPI00254929F7|nr:uncharacterized protein LOC104886575 [Beta vulgaris subsp. vulgaris]
MLDENVPELFRVDCGRPSNAGGKRYLTEAELQRAHLYVLANTGILQEFEKGFEDHILQIRPTLRAEDVWVQHEAEYLDWFRSKVIQDKPNDDVLFALAMGPSTLVRTWNGYYVNGYNFQTQGSSKHKSTMNYGVCVSNDGGCNWMDNVRGMNIDQYKLVEVNHTKKYPSLIPLCYHTRNKCWTPTLSDPSDIPDYEEGDDEEESSFDSGDSEDDDDEDDGFWDDDSDDE